MLLEYFAIKKKYKNIQNKIKIILIKFYVLYISTVLYLCFLYQPNPSATNRM